MKILLTGGTGFIGSNFLRQALARGHEVAALASSGKTLPENLRTSKNLTWLRGNLAEAPWSEIAAFAAETCVHTAWITTPGVYVQSPENFRFLTESLQFLRRARESGAKHSIALGTCMEYQIGRELLHEDRTPLDTSTPYARSKNELRLALEADSKAHGTSLGWARIFYPYGPGEHPARLCTSIIQKLTHGEEVILKTPNSTKDYIYIDDLGAALLQIVEKRFSGIINFGTGIGTSVREIAQTLAGLMGKPNLIEEIHPPEIDPLGYVVADMSRLKQLGWEPAHTIHRGLEKMLAANAFVRFSVKT